jgi:hypothetical protein
MTRLILGLGLAFAIGCTSIQPVGPLAGKMGGTSGAKGKADKDKDAPLPVTIPAVKPTPPMTLIQPDEVMPDNPQAAAQKLQNELEADGKSITPPPKTAEVSRYKGGVKQDN